MVLLLVILIVAILLAAILAGGWFGGRGGVGYGPVRRVIVRRPTRTVVEEPVEVRPGYDDGVRRTYDDGGI